MCTLHHTLSLLTGIVLSTAGAAAVAHAQASRPFPSLFSGAEGLCVVLGGRGCEVALEMATVSEWTIFVQLADEADVQAACRRADAAGLYGRRIFIAGGPYTRIQLADNLADVIIADNVDVPKAELLRVLRPGGTAILGESEMTKPAPTGVDDWSHHYHGPDNNPQSNDQRARAPYLTQFIATPRYAPAPQMAVASAGRVFAAFGHVAWHEREEPWLNTLIAFNGYNGSVLWRRPITEGIMVDRSTMIATPEVLYLADDTSCKMLDPATGDVVDEIIPPTDLTGGTFWKWMALTDGVLYGLVGEAEDLEGLVRWRRRSHGWWWGQISTDYDKPEHSWGLGGTLVAIDPKTKQVLWHYKSDEPIDSRGLCTADGRVFLCTFGRTLTCLDAADGKPLWQKTPQTDPDLFAAIGEYRPGQSYQRGWKSQAYLKCTADAVYFIGPQLERIAAVAATTGELMWTHEALDAQMVINDDGLYVIGRPVKPIRSWRLDPLTGAILAEYKTRRRGCTRVTGGADGVFFRAWGGSERFDRAAEESTRITPMRPSCHVGVLIANGHLYWLPWACDCNLQMYGFIACGPAGDFQFNREAGEIERLQRADGEWTPKKRFIPKVRDWATYRANARRTAYAAGWVTTKPKLLWETDLGMTVAPTAPVTVGGSVFLSGADGIVRALDAATGKPRWKAYTGGPVLFPPTIAKGLALVGSGDGWAYALDAATGKRRWRFRAAPIERRIPIYDTLQSTWPVASGVLVHKDTAYFAAGINNYDGTHVYAVDVTSGAIKWQNNTSGHLDAASQRGVSVQGAMLLNDGLLYMPGGNYASPGVYDVATGKCLNELPVKTHFRGRELSLTDHGRVDRRGALIEGRSVTIGGQPLYSHPDMPVYDGANRPAPAVANTSNTRIAITEDVGPDGPIWRLVSRGMEDDQPNWSITLPGQPVRWGIAIDQAKRIFVTLRGGKVMCYTFDT